MANQQEKITSLEKKLQAAETKNQALKSKYSELELMFNNLYEVVWLMNKDFEFTYISPTIKKSLGYTFQEIKNIGLFNLCTAQSAATLEKAFSERKQGLANNKEKTWRLQLKHKTGLLIWVETTTNIITNNNGDFDGITGVSRDITQQIALEEKMKENEVNLQAQIDNTSDSIWSIDDAYCLKTLNHHFKIGFKMAFGIDLQVGTSIINSLPEPFRSQWKARYDKALKGENFTVTDHFEFEQVPQYVEVSFNPIKFDNKIIGVTVFSRDITVQVLSKESLAESSANLSSTIEHTNDRIWSIDSNYSIITINKNFHDDFNQAFNVQLKKGSYALENVPEPLNSVWIERYDRVLNGESFIINDDLDIDGVPQYIEVSLNPIIANKKIIGATCFSRDITKQKLAEIKLKDSENRYKSLVANIPSVSYRCLSDKNWTMLFISDEIETLTGYPATEFIHNVIRSYSSIIHPDDKEYVELVVTEKLQLKERFNIEYRIINNKGEVKWVHERGRGVYNNKGDIETIDGAISDITRRKQSEQELQNSELKFRILSDASIDMLLLNSTNDVLQYITEALSKRLNSTVILGSSINQEKAEISFSYISGINSYAFKKAKNILTFNPIGKSILLNKDLEKHLRKGSVIKLKTDLKSIFSNKVTSEISDQIIKESNINEIHTIGINKENQLLACIHFFTLGNDALEDINFIESFVNLSAIVLQRQLLIDEIKLSEDKFRSIFENTSSIISIETENKILLANKGFEKVTGYTNKDLQTLNPEDLFHPEDKNNNLTGSNLKENNKEAQSYVTRIVDKHFNEKWLDITTSEITFEGRPAILTIGSDITERKMADLELNKFSTGIMNSPSSIVITDIDGKIEYVNPFFTEATGYTFEEAVGQNPNILSSGSNSKETYQKMWGTILKGEVWNGELENKNKQGNVYWEAVRIAPIFDQNNLITNFIAIKEDITERKRTLELIEQSEKDLRDSNAKKDKFFSIIAHDLRSPFSGLAGLTQVLKNSLHELSTDEVDKYLDLINQSTQSIYKLLENLLSWAKSQTGKLEFKPKKQTLKKIVDDTISVVKISAENKNISIESKISDSQLVFADENMLNTIIRNLLSNALKYTHKKGIIKIHCEEKVVKNNLATVICVEDNGVGIPKDKQSKLFNIEDNYSTKGTEKENGTGLGLILCKEFVERHAGRIWCESDENKGSKFFFSLPIR